MKYSWYVASSLMGGLLVSLLGCSGPKPAHQLSPEQATLHSPYDDSTLHNTHLPVLMPYNRLLAPAGRVVAYDSRRSKTTPSMWALVPAHRCWPWRTATVSPCSTRCNGA
ncbi:MAG: hypothetical protein WKG07_42290 [Hymenobacter sp.]